MGRALTSDRCKVVVQLNTRASTTRHWLAAGKKPRVEKVVPLNRHGASDPDALTAFLDAARGSQRADSTALVVLCHGRGLDHVHSEEPRPAPATPASPTHAPAAYADVFERSASNHNVAGVGQLERTVGGPQPLCTWRAHSSREPRTSEHLSNIDLRRAIARSLQKRVQVLGLNACWMATLEVAYELRAVADIQIASQAYASQWPYQAIIEQLSRTPAPSPADLARMVVAAVRDQLQDDTVSAIHSGAALDDLVVAFDRVAKRAHALVATDWEAIAKVVSIEERVEDPYVVDVRLLLEALARHDARSRKVVSEALDRLHALFLGVAASKAHPGQHGMSILCPNTADVDLDDAYSGLQFRSGAWLDFLRAYQAKRRSLRGR